MEPLTPAVESPEDFSKTLDFSQLFRDREERKQTEKQAHIASLTGKARTINEVLLSVVRPIAKLAAEDMRKNRINGEVEGIKHEHGLVGEAPDVQLVHRSYDGMTVSIARLIYTGHPETSTITMEMTGTGAFFAISGAATMVVHECTKERVRDDVAEFLRRILAVI